MGYIDKYKQKLKEAQDKHNAKLCKHMGYIDKYKQKLKESQDKHNA